jgi:hypothetical protein
MQHLHGVLKEMEEQGVTMPRINVGWRPLEGLRSWRNQFPPRHFGYR